MKQLVTLCIILLGLTVSAAAKEEPDIQLMPSVFDCMNISLVDIALKERFGELPLATGLGKLSVVTPTDIEEANNITIIYVNPETLTFSIVAVFTQEQMACIITTGNNFKPFVKDGIEL